MILPKKVLILASWYPRFKGDTAGCFIVYQEQGLRKTEDVHVVDCTHPTRLIPLKLWPWLKARLIIKDLKNKNWKPDIIHAHIAYPAGAVALYLKSYFSHVPVVITEHTRPKFNITFFGSLEKLKKFYNEFNSVIAVSDFLKKEIESDNENYTVSVLGNIVQSKFFTSPINTDVSQASAIYIGKLTEAKGARFLLESLIEYDRGNGPDFQLRILGLGPLKSEIEERSKILKKVKISFLPWGETEVNTVLNQSSFFLLPSYSETFSLVAAEALAMGRPVLGFKCGGPEDFIRDDRGLLLDHRNVKQYAIWIEKYASDPKLKLNSTSCTAKRGYIEDHYSQESICSKLNGIYNGLING